MLNFHLKKEWYFKIEKGIKTHEYREVKPYWTKRLQKIFPNDIIIFSLGYPKHRYKKEPYNYLFSKIISIKIVDGNNTDLKINKKVYDIKFKTIDYRGRINEVIRLFNKR